MEKIILSGPAQLLAERDGVEMGVLGDGTPFLTSRGLARLCGVAASTILEWLPFWDPESGKARDVRLAQLLAEHHHPANKPILLKTAVDKRIVNAHPDTVCMAVLEYYAFDAGPNRTEHAANAFRALAKRTLADLIYDELGYTAERPLPPEWRQFHDRLKLNKLPAGYFGVFREMADLLVSGIQHGLVVDARTMPDISVGIAWGKYWTDPVNACPQRFGPRIKHPHEYPDYFPQSKGHPDAWVYPFNALGEFRNWLQQVYLPEKYPAYINGKVRDGVLPGPRAVRLLAAVVPPKLKQG